MEEDIDCTREFSSPVKKTLRTVGFLIAFVTFVLAIWSLRKGPTDSPWVLRAVATTFVYHIFTFWCYKCPNCDRIVYPSVFIFPIGRCLWCGAIVMRWKQQKIRGSERDI